MNLNDAIVFEMMKNRANENVFPIFSTPTNIDKSIRNLLVLKVAFILYEKQLTNFLAKWICSKLQKNRF